MDRAYNPPSRPTHTSVSRRAFLRWSLVTSASLAGILPTNTLPAYAQERELT